MQQSSPQGVEAVAKTKRRVKRVTSHLEEYGPDGLEGKGESSNSVAATTDVIIQRDWRHLPAHQQMKPIQNANENQNPENDLKSNPHEGVHSGDNMKGNTNVVSTLPEAISNSCKERKMRRKSKSGNGEKDSGAKFLKSEIISKAETIPEVISNSNNRKINSISSVMELHKQEHDLSSKCNSLVMDSSTMDSKGSSSLPVEREGDAASTKGEEGVVKTRKRNRKKRKPPVLPHSEEPSLLSQEKASTLTEPVTTESTVSTSLRPAICSMISKANDHVQESEGYKESSLPVEREGDATSTKGDADVLKSRKRNHRKRKTPVLPLSEELSVHTENEANKLIKPKTIDSNGNSDLCPAICSISEANDPARESEGNKGSYSLPVEREGDAASNKGEEGVVKTRKRGRKERKTTVLALSEELSLPTEEKLSTLIKPETIDLTSSSGLHSAISSLISKANDHVQESEGYRESSLPVEREGDVVSTKGEDGVMKSRKRNRKKRKTPVLPLSEEMSVHTEKDVSKSIKPKTIDSTGNFGLCPAICSISEANDSVWESEDNKRSSSLPVEEEGDGASTGDEEGAVKSRKRNRTKRKTPVLPRSVELSLPTEEKASTFIRPETIDSTGSSDLHPAISLMISKENYTVWESKGYKESSLPVEQEDVAASTRGDEGVVKSGKKSCRRRKTPVLPLSEEISLHSEKEGGKSVKPEMIHSTGSSGLCPVICSISEANDTVPELEGNKESSSLPVEREGDAVSTKGEDGVVKSRKRNRRKRKTPVSLSEEISVHTEKDMSKSIKPKTIDSTGNFGLCPAICSTTEANDSVRDSEGNRGSSSLPVEEEGEGASTGDEEGAVKSRKKNLNKRKTPVLPLSVEISLPTEEKASIFIRPETIDSTGSSDLHPAISLMISKENYPVRESEGYKESSSLPVEQEDVAASTRGEESVVKSRKKSCRKRKTPVLPCSEEISLVSAKEGGNSIKPEVVHLTGSSGLCPVICSISEANDPVLESEGNKESSSLPVEREGDAVSTKGEEGVVKTRKRNRKKRKTTVLALSEDLSVDVDSKENIPLPRISICSGSKKLLILDLNGLLVDVVAGPCRSRRAPIRVGKKSVFKRPFCGDFIKFCFERFEVGVWSSRTKKNLDRMVHFLFGKQISELLFCWDQSKCTPTGSKTKENAHKPLVLKELKLLWENEHNSLVPWATGRFSPSNTLLIDDSPYKALCNPPNTAIFPTPYNYQNPDDKSLGPGGDIRVYLEGLAAAEDVQDYVSQHPFGQPPLSPESPSWDFYSKIIQKINRRLLPH